MNRLLSAQIAQSRRADGSLDIETLLRLVETAYDEMDRDRRRTDRSIALMVEELDQLNSGLEQLVAERTAQLSTLRTQLEATLENVDQGIIMTNATGQILVGNHRAHELLGSNPERRFDRLDPIDFPFAAIAADGARRVELTRPGGIMLEVRAAALADGGTVFTILDITERRRREIELRQAEAEYRSLFENSVVGLYRTSIEGRQLRANPALVKLNGYTSETELLAAVNDISVEWYVDPRRRDEFVRRMLENGRVTDFVSEIYRHATREKTWVSESAWIVRGPNGEPLCFEGTVIEANERIAAQTAIEHMAHHDALTGLPNRLLFLNRLRSALATRAADGLVSVLCLDLDRFKEVNDSLGHPAGDALLRAASARLAATVRAGDLVARLGGDEFAILCVDASSPYDMASMAARIVDVLSAPYDIEGQQAVVSVSIGVAITTDSGGEPDTLLRNADIALYRAKNAGRHTYVFYEARMNAEIMTRRQVELDLRNALGNNELDLFLQPIVDIADGEVRSYEALLRWRHPGRGFVPPAEFIPVAEEAGLMAPIGEWVLHRACAIAAKMPGRTPVSINLSPVQFRDRTLVETIAAAIATAGIEPGRIEIEITESVLMMGDPLTVLTLNRLRGLGIRIALDDFGTGQSSLSYVQKFPFDKIKIDQSFVAKVHDDRINAAIVRAVVALGRDLDIDVIAEGVETEEQLACLKAEGCRWFQGYLFGRPAPAGMIVPGLDFDISRPRLSGLTPDDHLGAERRRHGHRA